MRRLPTLFACCCLAAVLHAQTSLRDLQRQFHSEAQQLAARSPSEAERQALLGKQIERLRQFTDKEATADDRWNGRLMLADFQLASGDRAGATKTLRQIDPEAAPALLLVSAACMAQSLNLKAERDAWIAAALKKETPLDDQLAMARLLELVLHETSSGDDLLAKALAAATDNEVRAKVRWHRADIMRDREDLPENAGFDEFSKLATELPSTYWGSVARDRLRATELKPGDAAIDFTAKTRAGTEFHLGACKGKAVVLAFFSTADYDTATLVGKLRELRNAYKDHLVVVGICLDTDDETIAAAIKSYGIDFPILGDGSGARLDAAMRWGVEGPAIHVIDKAGNIAGLGMHVGTADARAELDELVEKACK